MVTIQVIPEIRTMGKPVPHYTQTMPFDRQRLLQLRQARVLTQAELGTQAGISELSVHKIETGQQKPRPATIRKLARALGVKPTDLMEPAS